jgi:hypothetical protein
MYESYCNEFQGVGRVFAKCSDINKKRWGPSPEWHVEPSLLDA